MESLDIQITQAEPEEESIITQLMELYIYDFTEIWSFDIKDNGRYDYEKLPLYWKDPNKYPYLIRVDKKLAGFALVQKGSPIESDTDIWDIAEFFIMRKFRKQGVGQMIAHQIWKKHPGRWQIRVLVENKKAVAFWESSISIYTQLSLSPNKMEINGDSWQIYKFNSNPT